MHNVYFLLESNTKEPMAIVIGGINNSKKEAYDLMLDSMAKAIGTTREKFDACLEEGMKSDNMEAAMGDYRFAVGKSSGYVTYNGYLGNKQFYYIKKIEDGYFLDGESIDKMFAEYIRRKKLDTDDPGTPFSYGAGIEAGKITQDEKWLKLLGIDISITRIQQMVSGERCVHAYDDLRINHYRLNYFRSRKDNGAFEFTSFLQKDDYIDDDAFIEALVAEETLCREQADSIVSIEEVDRE